jgi:hypothetical protein
MLTSSQSGSHEIEAVESGAGIAGDLNYMRDERPDQAATLGRFGKNERVTSRGNFTRLLNGRMQRSHYCGCRQWNVYITLHIVRTRPFTASKELYEA